MKKPRTTGELKKSKYQVLSVKQELRKNLIARMKKGDELFPDIIGIEDFITNNPRGHCEYFATALTLMLRTRGIPARMMVGFKCDEWNRKGRFFQVRELHAHTWVEAYMEPGHVAPDLLPESWRGKGPVGGWLRLDPTPAAPTRSTMSNASSTSFLKCTAIGATPTMRRSSAAWPGSRDARS